MRKFRTSSNKDQQDGGCCSVPAVTVDQDEDAEWQTAVDWLKNSNSALLFDIAERLISKEEFDREAVKSRMPSPLHWDVIKRQIDIVEGRGTAADNGPSSATTDDIQTSFSLMSSMVQIGGHDAAQEGVLDNFSLSNDPLGHAFLGDFSREDMDQLRALAHLELAVQFETAGQRPAYRSSAALSSPAPSSPLPPPSPTFSGFGSWRRNKSPNGGKSSGGGSGGSSSWFGVSLESILELERKRGLPETQVPHLVNAMIDRLQSCGLKEEGIFRISGSVAAIRDLRERIEKEGPKGSKLAEADPHDVASLLKGFLRDLPRPLISGPYVEYYRCLDQLPSVELRLRGINLLIMLLPKPASYTLQAVVNLLGSILEHSEENRMSLRSLATVMTPSLLPAELTSTLGDSERSVSIVELIINYRQLIWRVPATLVRNLRTCKCLFRGLSRLNHRDLEDSVDGIFNQQEVNLTLPDGTQRNISLPPGCTAADLIEQYCEGASYSNFKLYEIGGNIKERRLQAGTQLRRLLDVNPKMSLAIRAAN